MPNTLWLIGPDGDRDFCVWLQLGGDVKPPHGNTVVIGVGKTPEAAISNAREELIDLVDGLDGRNYKVRPA